MTEQEKLELQKLFYHIMNLGDANSMIRRYFVELNLINTTKRKVWQKFILEYIDKIK